MTTNRGWVPLIDAKAVARGDNVYLEAEGRKLLVHRVEDASGDRFFVTSSQCPHEDFTMDRCALKGRVITCVEHGWQMDVATGEVIGEDDDWKLPTYPAEVRDDGRVWAKLY